MNYYIKILSNFYVCFKNKQDIPYFYLSLVFSFTGKEFLVFVPVFTDESLLLSLSNNKFISTPTIIKMITHLRFTWKISIAPAFINPNTLSEHANKS
jgi:hypothetical protein